MEKYSKLEALRQSIKACSLCNLQAENQKIRNLNAIDDIIDEDYGLPVPGYGSPSARILICGEAPGRDEVRQGLPFVGRAGQLLRNVPEETGAPASLFWIANVINCRPINNVFPTDKTMIQACLPWLQKQIGIIRPLVIIGCGDKPLKHLIGVNSQISKVRGKAIDWYVEPIDLHCKYIPVFHPSFCLRPGRSFNTPKRDLTEGQKVLAMSQNEKQELLAQDIYKAVHYVLTRKGDGNE